MTNTFLTSKKFYFILGIISGLSFAPVFFIPGLFSLGYLCYQTSTSSVKKSIIIGFVFGLGHFLSSMYWVSFAIIIYIEEFWWAFPFALFGLPCILACFTSLSCLFSSIFSDKSHYYQIIFCLFWILFEWIRSWIFTGLPWNLLIYALGFSEILVQPVNIIGPYGLSFIVVYVSTNLYYYFLQDRKRWKAAIFSCIVILSSIIAYGICRLNTTPTTFSSITARIVQPSIPQISKWDQDLFWRNLDKTINLSIAKNKVDLILWPEASLVVPYKIPVVKQRLIELIEKTNSTLITGTITENHDKIHTSIVAIKQNGSAAFEYHKSHLVPFGEYMPFRQFLPIKKLTHGMLDYTAGNSYITYLSDFNIYIRPLLCYESIFPSEVKVSNKIADIIINATNDAWYGNSSGPYQHLHISRIRAIENALPLLRAANNGISAVIDPVGRILQKTKLDEVTIIDTAIPKKLPQETLYSIFGDITAIIAIFFVLAVHYLSRRLYK